MRLSALAYSPHLAEHLAKESAASADYWHSRAEGASKAIELATFVAVGAGAFVGVVDGFLSEGGETVEIGGMWVAPALRRSGIGQSLLAAVCGWARERGASRAGLWVRATNEPARLLYERAGFTATASDPGAAGLRLELTLEYPLPPLPP